MLENIVQLDISLFWLINKSHNLVLDYFFLVFTNFGSGWIITPILVFFVVKKIPKKHLKAVIIVSTIAMSASGIINSRLKKVFDRPRPILYFKLYNTEIPSNELHVVGKPLKYRAFPSGHTNTAFSAAMLLALLFGGWFWLSLIVAALVGYSRIYMGVHFPLDVLAGAVLGIFTIIIIVGTYKWFFRKNKT